MECPVCHNNMENSLITAYSSNVPKGRYIILRMFRHWYVLCVKKH